MFINNNILKCLSHNQQSELISEDLRDKDISLKDIISLSSLINDKIFVMPSSQAEGEDEYKKYFQIKSTCIKQNDQTSIML